MSDALEAEVQISNVFLRNHLQYVEHTEPPHLMKLWSAITAASACLGRHTYWDWDAGAVYPNLYVLLVGPPAVRKGVAMKQAMRLVRKNTGVVFAPDDTSGKRQGIISSLSGFLQKSTNDEWEINGNQGIDDMSLDDLASLEISFTPDTQQFAKPDPNVMCVAAEEWGSFIGPNNMEFIRFLIRMWDGDDYVYALKNEQHTLRDPLLIMQGCTTPTDLGALIPPEAIGQGFMSRVILVHASKKPRLIPPSKVKLDKKLEPWLIDMYNYLHADHRKPMTMGQEALRHFDRLYSYVPAIQDARFLYYTERRFIHMLKVALILAATNKRFEIISEDLDQAHQLLKATELTMDQAMGEFGLTKEAEGRQVLAELLKNMKRPVLASEIGILMARDMTPVKLQLAISDFTQAKKIIAVDTDQGPAYIWRDEHIEIQQLLE